MIDKKILKETTEKLKKHNLKIATAESCTGGLIGHTLTNISGSSNYFDRGIISYSNKAKIKLLDVSKKTLEKHGAVSEQVAYEMAEGIRKKSQVDIGVSSTGIAGPTGGTKEKPVGLVYIGFSNVGKTIVEKHVFDKDRLGNKEETVNAVLKLIKKNIK